MVLNICQKMSHENCELTILVNGWVDGCICVLALAQTNRLRLILKVDHLTGRVDIHHIAVEINDQHIAIADPRRRQPCCIYSIVD
jgi:hypothetical protein